MAIDSSDTSPERLLRSLRRIQRHTVHIAGRAHDGVTHPSAEQLELFSTVGIDAPRAPC